MTCKIVANSQRHDLRPLGYLEYFIEANVNEGAQDTFNRMLQWKLGIQRRGWQGNIVAEMLQISQGVGNRRLGMIRTAPDTLAAVNAPCLGDTCFASPDANGFRRTAFYAAYTTLTQVGHQSDRMVSFSQFGSPPV